MATRLEGVFIPVELDTSKAQKQLDDLERGANKTADKVNQSLSKPGTRGPSGTLTGPRTFKPTGGPSNQDIQEGLYSDFQRFMRIDRMRKFGMLRIEDANKKASISGKLTSIAEGFIGDLGPATARLAGFLYAGGSVASKAAPLALEVGRSAAGLSSNDPMLKAVQDQMIALQNSFNYIESYVKSAITGIGKTYDMATAMARVNGKVPNIFSTYGIYKEADMQEDMLNKKFEFFKTQEVATAVGASLSELFKDGINR